MMQSPPWILLEGSRSKITQHESSSMGEFEAREVVSYRNTGFPFLVTAYDASFSFILVFVSASDSRVSVLVDAAPVLVDRGANQDVSDRSIPSRELIAWGRSVHSRHRRVCGPTVPVHS